MRRNRRKIWVCEVLSRRLEKWLEWEQNFNHEKYEQEENARLNRAQEILFGIGREAEAEAKAPSTKDQAPEKLQTPSSSVGEGSGTGNL